MPLALFWIIVKKSEKNANHGTKLSPLAGYW